MSDQKVTSVTVVGNLGVFHGGQVLTDRSTIASYIRTILDTERDTPVTITDETILALIDEEVIPEGMCDEDKEIVWVEAIEMYLAHPAKNNETVNA
jgi:hypothetical protein